MKPPTPNPSPKTRRAFLSQSAAAASLTLLNPRTTFATQANSQVSIGLIGCGGRGKWITDLFRKHGGYHLAAVADYFPDRAETAADELGAPANRRFAGREGFKRLLDLPLDAVVIQTPPYFHPEQTAAAVDAGKHVFLAKPVAVDVPGCLTIEAAGRKATAKRQVFLVDFQTRAHPAYQEVARWIHSGRIGRVITAESNYQTSLMFPAMGQELARDPDNPELRLRCWAIDRVLSGDVITEQNIHALDVLTWFLDAAPSRAVGTGGLSRGFGSCWDHFALVFTFPNRIPATFSSKQAGHAYDDILCRVYGSEGTVDSHYFGEVWARSRTDGFNSGKLANLYTDGAVRNIATFHAAITSGDASNPTVPPSVRSNLTTILGRTAAREGTEVTWDDMMRRNEHLEFPAHRLRA